MNNKSKLIPLTAALVLLASFNNCGSGFETLPLEQELSSSSSDSTLPPPQICSPNEVSSCTERNGLGSQVCSANGNSYGECVLSACDTGFNLTGNECLRMACAPGTTVSCTGVNGSGIRVCDSTGSGFGACQLNACSAGFHLSNGACVSNPCTAGSSQICNGTNGAGSQSCKADGTAWNPCVLSSCNSGFHLENGQCIANTCEPGVSAPCRSGNGAGEQICSSNGSGYGACSISTCDAGYFLSSGVCVAQTCTPNIQTQACSLNNGTGTQTCNVTGNGWNACRLIACNIGFNLQDGVCVAQACTPGSTQNCSGGNGTGLQTCNLQGSGFGTCVLNACNDGYTFSNGVCVTPPTYPIVYNIFYSAPNANQVDCKPNPYGFPSVTTPTGAFPPIESVSGKYLSSNGMLFHLCKKLEGVDGAGFKIHRSQDLLGEMFTSGGVLYINRQNSSVGDLEPSNFTLFRGPPVNRSTFKVYNQSCCGTLDSGYWGDDSQIFYINDYGYSVDPTFTKLDFNPSVSVPTKIMNEIIKTSSAVYVKGVKASFVRDPASFNRFAGSSDFLADNLAVYAVGDQRDLFLLDLPRADATLVGFFKRYIKSCSANRVYYLNIPVSGADCATFTETGLYEAKDANSCYVAGLRVGPASDPKCAD